MGLSRRTLFAHIGAFCGLAAARTIGPAHSAETSPSRFFLTEREAQLLVVLCDRLIPEDDFPSASQAGVVDYIDLQLATAWGQGEGLYLQGPWQRGAPEQGYQLRYTPAELYRRALGGLDVEAGANGFTGLGPDDQEAYLARLKSGEASPGGVPGDVFFAHLWQNTLECYFEDPAYHGNRDYAGWRMLSFPGPHAHYLSEVDMHNMVYLRPPTGMTHDPVTGPRLFSPQELGYVP